MDINLFLINNSEDNSRVRYVAAACLSQLLAVVLTFFSFPIFLSAQTAKPGDIQGTVIDRKRQKPLVSHPLTLTVHRADTVETQQTTTDENGNYRFEGLPLDPSVHYTLSTLYEGTDYIEKDLVLSTWAPKITLDFNIGAFTDDKTQIQVKTHTFIIGPPPADHAPDGAVTVIEVISVENRSELPFQTKHGSQTVGIHLALPKGVEGFQPHSSTHLTLSPATNEVVLTTPLPPGESQFGYTYIFHVERNGLDVSRRLNFDTAEFTFFVPEGVGFVPRANFFGAPRREQIHNSVYLLYQSTGKTFKAGERVDLALNVNMGAVRGPGPGQTSNIGRLILVAVAAALTGGFFVAALFKLRAPNNNRDTDPNETTTPPDEGWIRKLNPDDREHVRIARLEFITYLDDKYEKEQISERVYKRLRREQTERLTTLLAQQKREQNA